LRFFWMDSIYSNRCANVGVKRRKIIELFML
jgi:hypothetical protein